MKWRVQLECAIGFALVLSGTATVGLAQDDGPIGIDAGALIGEPAQDRLDGEALEAKARGLAQELRCPVCQGLSVADSPTASAVAMYQQIRDLVAAGYSRDQVLGYFEGTYGEFVRLQPRARGLNLIVWIGPPLLFGLVVGGWLIGRRRRLPATTSESSDDDPDLEAYLDRVRADVRDSPDDVRAATAAGESSP